ncbi:MAG: glycosyl hydrolase family 43 [Candidatus Cryosericum sp.]
MTIQEFLALDWHLLKDEPLIRPPGRFAGPIVADPTFSGPDTSPDGRWHLFAHTIHGIEHFVSDDGETWAHAGRVTGQGMRAYLVLHEGVYFLFYEQPRFRYADIMSLLHVRWHSRIVVITSPDLVCWSAPETALEPSLSWHMAAPYGESVSNPCVVSAGDKWLLYYSAGLTHVADCGFEEPTFVGVAVADSIKGPFVPLPEPILSPDPNAPTCNLCCGSIKVMKLEDGFAGVQNGIYVGRNGKSGSALLRLTSRDGFHFDYVDRQHPFFGPNEVGGGWMRSHVYACDFRPVPAMNAWYLYFNARNDWSWTRGRERIGCLTVRMRPQDM